MSRRHWPTGIGAVALGLLLVAGSASGAAPPLRISNLVVTNSDSILLVTLVLLGAMPDGIVEGLGTGIPAAVRFQLELWQYNSWWVDRRVVAKLVERQVLYDVLTKEFRVAPLRERADKARIRTRTPSDPPAVAPLDAMPVPTKSPSR